MLMLLREFIKCYRGNFCFLPVCLLYTGCHEREAITNMPKLPVPIINKSICS